MATPLFFNGINGATGDYLFPPMPLKRLSALAQGQALDAQEMHELAVLWRRATRKTLGVIPGVDPTDLAASGWGVIFADDADPRLRGALTPLLQHRQKQASRLKPGRYKEYVGRSGYRPGESKIEFVTRQEATPGLVDPDQMPYYLLIVGDPARIPFRFQYQLDVQYAVGRICFDTLDEYERYARSVVAAEQASPPPQRTAVFFGVCNAGDFATKMSAAHLVEPLVAELDRVPRWKTTAVVGDSATKANLSTLLGGARTPSLLFTASHGLGFLKGDPEQEALQGALLCQDWPGPSLHQGPVPPAYFFAGDDVASDANLAGMIAFHFACFGAGTPQVADYVQDGGTPLELADRAFVARLPQRLLAHPKGGALAVVGHVERAWGFSFMWPGVGEDLKTFTGALQTVMDGKPLGHAMESFNMRYVDLSTDLSSERQEISSGKAPDDGLLSGLWTATNDSRNYVVLGDPAVRLS